MPPLDAAGPWRANHALITIISCKGISGVVASCRALANPVSVPPAYPTFLRRKASRAARRTDSGGTRDDVDIFFSCVALVSL